MRLETLRHSLSHILALAVKRIHGDVLFGTGPAIENGFYYDFDFQNKYVSKEDLPKIEKEMRKIIKEDFPFKKMIISKKEARRLFKDQPYKREILKELPEENVSIYQVGEFIDLCKGPHIRRTGQINPHSFKLDRIAGAYWKGSEKNPMLTRIYGIAFKTKKELEDFLKKREEAEKKDHRVLGKKLGIFFLDDEVGAGLPIWKPKGFLLRKIIKDFLYQELTKQGYQFVTTPHIGKISLWKKSGHWEHYQENIYSPIKIDNEEYLLKPMNCPFHVKVYKSEIRSYRDLPLRLAEFGTVYRYERSGVLHGLTRVRGFTQDDAHIWCTPQQLSEELKKLLKYGLKILKSFGFKDFKVYLSTRPEKYAGTDKDWKKATNALKYTLKTLGLKYEIDPGGGVFYGPKIDIKIKDSLGREWQCTTIQVDFNLPQRFNIAYINDKGKEVRPIMIHRALLGSLERFIGVLLEHYGGSLPFWLSPEQIWIIPVGSAHLNYVKKLGGAMKEKGFRVKIKDEKATVSKKIREGEIQKIPYILVVGDKEAKNNSARIRERGKGDIGEKKIEDLIRFFSKLEEKKK